MSPAFQYVAFASAVAALGTFVTGLLFFAQGGKWGPVNDGVSVLQMATTLPLVWPLFVLTRDVSLIPSIVILVAGVIGTAIPMVTQTLLVTGVLSFETANRIGTPPATFMGLWLIGANLMALHKIPLGLSIAGLAAGIGYVLLVTGFLIGRQKHPLFSIGSGVAIVGYVTWAIWFGTVLTELAPA